MADPPRQAETTGRPGFRPPMQGWRRLPSLTMMLPISRQDKSNSLYNGLQGNESSPGRS